MGDVDALAMLVDDAYRAAFSDAWEHWLIQATRVLNGVGASFWAVDRQKVAADRIIIHAPTARAGALDDYGAHYAAIDPQTGYVAMLTEPSLFLDTDHLDEELPAVRDYMHWQRHEVDFDHHMGVALQLGDRLNCGFTIHRARLAGHTSPHERRKLLSILPRLQNALELGFLQGDALLDAYWTGVHLGRRQPTLLLDERGCILRADAAMEAVLSSADGIGASNGRLRAADARDDARLQAVIGAAVARDDPAPGALRLRRPSGRSGYVATLYPLPRSSRLLAPGRAAAMLALVDPAATPATPAVLWQGAFGLTARESETAELLMSGHSIDSAAAAMGVSGNTARVHLRHLLTKTGTTRQAELVRLLARIA